MTLAHPSDAAVTLKLHGRSFWFASLFLPREVAADAARLYAFCRTLDDLADLADSADLDDIADIADITDNHDLSDLAAATHPRQTLAQVRRDLHRGASARPQVQDFLALAHQHPLPLQAADCLLATLIEDATSEVQIEDEAQLIRYAYGVAGTVGRMMSPILGARGPSAAQAAIHLGIAMQMTNIARDVLEDAANHRRYLPGSWVQHRTAQQLLEASVTPGSEARPAVASAILRLLALADRYYASAALGFPCIPARARRGIEIAAAVYREIGAELGRRDAAWWKGRVRVSTAAKLWLAAQVTLGRSPIDRLPGEPSPAALSAPLAGLPGVP